MNDINIIIGLPGGADGTEAVGVGTQNGGICFAPRGVADVIRREAAGRAACGSPLDRMAREYGYEMTRDEPDSMQWTSDSVTADDAGLNVRWQNVLTIKRTDVGRDCWTANFYHNREIRFMMQVFGGLSRTKALAFDALLAWHRSAKTAKVAR